MEASEISHLKGIPAQSILLCYPVAFCGQVITGEIVIRTLVLEIFSHPARLFTEELRQISRLCSL